MAIKILRQNEELKVKSIFSIIYGEPGSGKTSLANTSDPEAVLLDFDGGVKRAVKRKNVINIDGWADILEYFGIPFPGSNREFNPNAKIPFSEDFPNTKVIIIDTGGQMLDNYIARFVKDLNRNNMKSDGTLSLQGYGAMAECFNSFINPLKQMDYSIIMICHESEGGRNEESKLIPKMTGKSFDIIRAVADLMGRLYVDRGRRVLDFNPTDRHVGKNPASFQKRTLPHYEEADFDGFYGRVISETITHMETLSKEEMEVRELVKEVRVKIAASNDLDELLAIGDSISDKPTYFKIQVSGDYHKAIIEVCQKNHIAKCKSASALNKLFDILSKVPDPVKLKVFTSMKAKGEDIGVEYHKDAKSFAKKVEASQDVEDTAGAKREGTSKRQTQSKNAKGGEQKQLEVGDSSKTEYNALVALIESGEDVEIVDEKIAEVTHLLDPEQSDYIMSLYDDIYAPNNA